MIFLKLSGGLYCTHLHPLLHRLPVQSIDSSWNSLPVLSLVELKSQSKSPSSTTVKSPEEKGCQATSARCHSAEHLTTIPGSKSCLLLTNQISFHQDFCALLGKKAQRTNLLYNQHSNKFTSTRGETKVTSQLEKISKMLCWTAAVTYSSGASAGRQPFLHDPPSGCS